MYLRTISRKNKDGSVARYLQLAENEWDGERKYARARVLYSFGRDGAETRESLTRLVSSMTRFLSPEEALSASSGTELRFLSSRPLGGAYALDALWRELGLDTVLTRLLSSRAFDMDVERVLFALTANRALSPASKLSACEWVAEEAVIPGLCELSPDHCYRAMDFLLAAEAEIQREVFFSVADLLSLEVDLILFDTTSTYFECPEAAYSTPNRSAIPRDADHLIHAMPIS